MSRKNNQLRKHGLFLGFLFLVILGCAACSIKNSTDQMTSTDTGGKTGEETMEKQSAESTKTPVKEDQSSKSEAKKASETEESAKVPESTPLPTLPASKPEEVDRSAAFAVLKEINVGWNLGNTFDAHGSPLPEEDEMYWGNPPTTKELVTTIHDQGFNTIRIPVTWSDHVGEAPDYPIDAAWMDRVQQVVDYAMDLDMYVIVNTHHEPDYWLRPTMDEYPAVSEELCAIWKQIAERFQEYSEKLLFEGMNEPRIKGSKEEWSGGTQDNRKAINRLNNDFINTVRASGGNNATRICIITTNGGSVTERTMQDLYLPNDPYMMVAVHLYTPYDFTFDASQTRYSNWDGSHKSDIEWVMKLLDNTLISRGVPVFITEFGAVSKKDGDLMSTQTNEQDVVAWLKDYMTETNRYGIKCIWWDNGNYYNSGEKFAIYDRIYNTWYSQKIADALIENAKQK